ncbi:MAG: TIGR04255 family protein [Candidatus Lokiarchaeia archaeon]
MVDIFEVFLHPFLSEVVLELRFPTRLKIPNYIAEFQEKILKEFPDLNETILSKVIFISRDNPEIQHENAWEFKNPQNETRCRISKNRFSLISNKYISWNEHESVKGFKDILDFTLKNFLDLYSIEKFNRVGLRYINKIKMEEETSEWFKTYFFPLFNLEKYKLEDLHENVVRLIVMKSKEIEITIQSTFITEDNEDFYILDFDAYSKNVDVDILDSQIESLHIEILKEFHSLITEECRKKMRGV